MDAERLLVRLMPATMGLVEESESLSRNLGASRLSVTATAKKIGGCAELLGHASGIGESSASTPPAVLPLVGLDAAEISRFSASY